MRTKKIPTRPAGRAGASDRTLYNAANEASNELPQPAGDPAARLLERLEGVKQTGTDRWIACCSAHDDKRPSLSIRELADGTLLVHCWAGCGAADVVAAIGLSLSDLFPRKPENRPPLRPRERWIAADVWACVAHEAAVAAIVAADAAAGRPVSTKDAERAGVAADRLADAVQALGVGR